MITKGKEKLEWLVEKGDDVYQLHTRSHCSDECCIDGLSQSLPSFKSSLRVVHWNLGKAAAKMDKVQGIDFATHGSVLLRSSVKKEITSELDRAADDSAC